MKVWWKSKTFWVNILSVIGIVASSQYGVEWTPETTSALLVVINLILRAVTKEPITWTSK